VITIDLWAGGEKAPYHLGEGLLGQAVNLLQPWLEGRRAFVVSDANVGPLYAASLAETLAAPLLTLPAGEEHKQWPAVERVVRHLLANEAERGDLLVVVGGGVITDLVGFAAAVALRGLPWVAFPTTLLGMVDAAVGGKTGIDLDLGKNLGGVFWPPRAVIADPLVLATLDPRQLRAGLAEVVKSAMIAPSSMEHVLDSHLASAAGGDPLRAAELIGVCVRIKAEVVALDERESGPRKTLNLGHTLGHGLEAATRYQRFLHGEAVAWGLLAELRLARDRGLLSTEEAEKWAARIGALAPLPSLEGLSWEVVAPFIARDKKRTGGLVGWVLPRLGGIVLDVAVSDEEAADVYSLLTALPPAGPFDALF
jgi:3-dehydroquinate synthase